MWRSGGISIGASALLAYSAWIVWRDLPHRLNHIIGVFAGLTGHPAQPLCRSHKACFFHRPSSGEGLRVQLRDPWLGLLGVGLLDHRRACPKP